MPLDPRLRLRSTTPPPFDPQLYQNAVDEAKNSYVNQVSQPTPPDQPSTNGIVDAIQKLVMNNANRVFNESEPRPTSIKDVIDSTVSGFRGDDQKNPKSDFMGAIMNALGKGNDYLNTSQGLNVRSLIAPGAMGRKSLQEAAIVKGSEENKAVNDFRNKRETSTTSLMDKILSGEYGNTKTHNEGQIYDKFKYVDDAGKWREGNRNKVTGQRAYSPDDPYLPMTGQQSVDLGKNKAKTQEEQFREKMNLKLKELQLKQEAQANKKDKNQDMKGSALSALDAIEELDSTIKNSSFIPLNKTVNAVSREFGDVDLSVYDQTASLLNQSVIKAYQGGRMTDKDYTIGIKNVPNSNDPLPVRQAKAKQLRKILGNINNQGTAVPQTKGTSTKTADQKSINEQDQQALDWARKNKNDPRAKAISQHLGVAL